MKIGKREGATSGKKIKRLEKVSFKERKIAVKGRSGFKAFIAISVPILSSCDEFLITDIARTKISDFYTSLADEYANSLSSSEKLDKNTRCAVRLSVKLSPYLKGADVILFERRATVTFAGKRIKEGVFFDSFSLDCGLLC